MITTMKNTLLLLITLYCIPASSECTRLFEQNIGWTIVESKTIEGYRDIGKEKKGDFEGCDYDRTIYFMDGSTVKCNSYGYQYAYMPTAIILGKSFTHKGTKITQFKMIVESEEYDIQ